MTTTSIPKVEERVECRRHEGEECPRCDGSGMRAAKRCAGCGATGVNLRPARTARSWEEAKALPRYCSQCNPRRRNVGAVLAGLERMGA